MGLETIGDNMRGKDTHTEKSKVYIHFSTYKYKDIDRIKWMSLLEIQIGTTVSIVWKEEKNSDLSYSKTYKYCAKEKVVVSPTKT